MSTHLGVALRYEYACYWGICWLLAYIYIESGGGGGAMGAAKIQINLSEIKTNKNHYPDYWFYSDMLYNLNKTYYPWIFDWDIHTTIYCKLPFATGTHAWYMIRLRSTQ